MMLMKISWLLFEREKASYSTIPALIPTKEKGGSLVEPELSDRLLGMVAIAMSCLSHVNNRIVKVFWCGLVLDCKTQSYG